MDAQLQDFNANERIAELIRLKDEIKSIEDRQKDELRPLIETRMKLEADILAYLAQIKAQNISTADGTVSVLTRKTASLQDPAAFLRYVIDNGQWDLLDRKANTKAVEDFIKEHGVQPPGVNYTTMRVLGLRRK